MSPGDVALGADGTLYSTDSYVLYRVDRANAAALAVASILSLHLYNALGVAHDGMLQATADLAQVLRSRPQTDPQARSVPFRRVTAPAATSRCWAPAFWWPCLPARIRRRTLVPPDATSLTAPVIGDVGFSCVWGLATRGGAVYGLTCEGRVLLIDATSGVGTELSRAVPAFFGAAAR